MAEKSIRVQRREAEERSEALLRAVIPDSELRWNVERGLAGRIVKRHLTGAEFTGQLGTYIYTVNFHSTSENIGRVHIESGRRGGLCGGPYPWGDYVEPGQGLYLGVGANQSYNEAVRIARDQGTQPLSLPRWDIWLGQYLALKYDEKAFLRAANAY